MNHPSHIPEFFNIGSAVTDAHLGTPVESHTALIVEEQDQTHQSCSFGELAALSSRFHATSRGF